MNVFFISLTVFLYFCEKILYFFSYNPFFTPLALLPPHFLLHWLYDF